ncbi:unnamed protein product [Macrosiphum euphorbiae]|uniref:THAP-type domain-containing protein n=1 Tax=Macrosiphum euphorbiae TaxID=13131 RepID=A0AAV0WLW2_9HEMI|nr:unnamed protein product [Macrosiphum euphorbiae]
MSCCIRSPHSVANTIFEVPKNELEKYKWEEALGMKLKKSNRVCASHFNECDIISCWNSGLNHYSFVIKDNIIIITESGTMSQERLDSLMLIFIKKKMASEINIEEVIDEFKTCVPIKRRLEL